MSKQQPNEQFLQKKFSTLHSLAFICKLLGVTVGVLGAIAGPFLVDSMVDSMSVLFLWIFAILSTAGSMLMIGETIEVVLAAEKNTRLTAYYTYLTYQKVGLEQEVPERTSSDMIQVLRKMSEQFDAMNTQVATLTDAVNKMAGHSLTLEEKIKAIEESSRATAIILHKKNAQ